MKRRHYYVVVAEVVIGRTQRRGDVEASLLGWKRRPERI